MKKQIKSVNKAEESSDIPLPRTDLFHKVARLPIKNYQSTEHKIDRLTFHRVKALDARSFRVSALDHYVQHRVLKPTTHKQQAKRTGLLYNSGRFATYISHLSTWVSAFLSRTPGEEYVLILEDDVILQTKLADIISLLDTKVREHEIEWDVIFIGHAVSIKGEEVIPRILLRGEKGIWKDINRGMFAYLLHLPSVPKLLQLMIPVPAEPYFAHVDNRLREFYDQLNVFYTTNKIIKHVDEWQSVRVLYDKPRKTK